MTDLDLAYLSAREQARLIAARQVSPVELIDNALARIEAVNPSLNCFCAVWVDEARLAAVAATEAVADGATLGPLHGVPVAVKDTTPTAGHRTTLGSFAFEHWVPATDATIVRSLRRAGAIIVGKTTTPEFAHTLVTESPLWGVTRNPWNLDRTPGGSSGGSGAAVASGCVPLAEGSDMGGSVRIPAAWSGVVGLKPSLGRIPMDVLPGLFDTISHHGPLARCVDDARLFLNVTQGPDDADIMSLPDRLELSAPLDGDVRGLRVGVSTDLGCWAVDAPIVAAVRRAADALVDAGAVVRDVDVAIRPDDEAVWMAMWAAFMAGYYGEQFDAHRDRISAGVVDLVERGRMMSAVDLKRTDIARADLWRRVAPVFAEHDVLLCPTMSVSPLPASLADPTPAAPVDDGRYHAPDMTSVFNLISPCPAISVPAALDSDGLPIGVQVVGRRWRDDLVLRVANAIELGVPTIGNPPIV